MAEAGRRDGLGLLVTADSGTDTTYRHVVIIDIFVKNYRYGIPDRNYTIIRGIPIVIRTTGIHMTSAETIHRMIDELPPDLRQEAIHYIEEISRRRKKQAHRKFSLNWAGGLSHLKFSTTSIELQHKVHEWRDSLS